MAFFHVVIQGLRLLASQGSAIFQSLVIIYLAEEEGKYGGGTPTSYCFGSEVADLSSAHILLVGTSHMTTLVVRAAGKCSLCSLVTSPLYSERGARILVDS